MNRRTFDESMTEISDLKTDALAALNDQTSVRAVFFPGLASGFARSRSVCSVFSGQVS
jgi:hypothetical protein